MPWFAVALIPPPVLLFPYTTLFRSVRLKIDAKPVGFGQGGDLLGRPALVDDAPGLGMSQDDVLQHRVGRDQLPVLVDHADAVTQDRKSTRLNSSHVKISYAVLSLKK